MKLMTPQDNFDAIRSLLGRYYDGLTSPEENCRIENFFSSADYGELPDDLAEEAAFFSMMKCGEDVLAASAPEYLEENLRAIIDGEEYESHRRSKLIRFVARFAAAAAVAALLITAGVRMVDTVDMDMVEPVAADDVMLTLVLPPTPADDPVEEKSKPLMASVAEHHPAQHVFVPVETPDINDMPDNYIEITNMDQARMLVQDAFALVREKLAYAGLSLSSASDGLRQIEYAMCETIIN